MTFSFSTMLLSAASLFDQSPAPDATPARRPSLALVLDAHLPGFIARARATRVPQRAVFFGSGPRAFASREAALKVMELSASRIPTLWDCTLGFRHGPKSFTVGETDLWPFRSSGPRSRAHDDDRRAKLRGRYPHSQIIAPEVLQPHRDHWSAPLYVALMQLRAVHGSDAPRLNVDDPFSGQGTLTRVVCGVTLHPVMP